MSCAFVSIATILLVFRASTTATTVTAPRTEDNSDRFTSSDEPPSSTNTTTNSDTESENELQLNENDLKEVLPDIENFKKKYKKLKKKLRKITRIGFLKVKVNRDTLFNDSFKQIVNAKEKKILRKWLRLSFANEFRLDFKTIGLTREWFTLISEYMFSPTSNLFKYVDEENNNYRLQINPDSGLCYNNHLDYYKFFARMVALAIIHGNTITASLIKPFYLTILGKKIQLNDVQTVDPKLYRNLKNIIDDPEDQTLYSTVIKQVGLARKKVDHDLIPNGSTIVVTKDNVGEYINSLLEWTYETRVQDQMSAFLKELDRLIPLDYLREFDETELEILFNGIRKIDVEDWKKHSIYCYGYKKDSDIIKWFWEIIEEFDDNQRAKIVQFVTGTDIVPIGGFRKYYPYLFSIFKLGNTKDPPKSNTSYQQLWLPPYPDKKRLEDELIKITKTPFRNLYQLNDN